MVCCPPAGGLPAKRSPGAGDPAGACVKLESRDAGATLALTGTVQAETEINQAFRIDGRLIERTVDVGDIVKPGQLIARLDPQNEESGLQAARAQLAAAQAQLTEARTNTPHARARRRGRGVACQFDQAESLLKAAGRRSSAVTPSSNWRRTASSYTRLVSDAAGVVTARGPQPGEVVSAGRMIIQVAREGARRGVRRAGADQGQRRPGPDIRRFADRRSQRHCLRPRA